MLIPVLVFGFVAGCGDDDDEEDMGYEATIDDFSGYDSWERVDYVAYPVNMSTLGTAHAGANEAYVRDVFMSSDASMSGGEWAEGSIFVKEVHEFDSNQEPDWGSNGALMGMVKRGGDYNPDHGGWEWFLLSGDGSSIEARGGDLMDGACNSCHAQATDDYVFEHPASYMLESGGEVDFFADGAMNWERVDSTYGTDEFLSGAHGDDTEYSREVFRRQAGGVAKDGLFPVGTVLLKRLSKLDGQGNREYPEAGGFTAMVKNSMNEWEWFMMNPQNGELVNRGGDDVMTNCASCHSQATGANGMDMVFSHPGLGN
ncbi:hypothetical protein GF324_02555 [bacterium]|nr:hypothetical protein [bacterium]